MFKKIFFISIDLLVLFILSVAILDSDFLRLKGLWIIIIFIKVMRPHFKFLQIFDY